LTLHGYRYSVYTRIVALILTEKALSFDYAEVDPFGALPDHYENLHPFGRVPVLDHAGFQIYETAAVIQYLDERFPAPSLQPADLHERARMRQIIAIADNYAYWPLVRQVYARRVFGPAHGEATDAAAIEEGLKGAEPVLTALERMTADQHLDAENPMLADLHLAPMIAAFAAAPEGAALLARYPCLSQWWWVMAGRASLAQTWDMLLTDKAAVASPRCWPSDAT
jgi:glutathione S-transferase